MEQHMFKRIVSALLFWGVAWSAAGTPPQSPLGDDAADDPQRWSCFTASDAQMRKQRVERNLLPRVAFVGETGPVGIEARMARHKTPALSVAVIRNGELDWSAAWGRLRTDGAQAGCDSLFQAGSLAKPATVLAAMRMQEQGIVDFDEDIETYLSSWHLPKGRQTDANPVTLRNLFTHTAGITPGGYEGYAQGQPVPTDQQTVRAEAPSNSRKVEVSNAPGTSLVYSGGGYTVVEIALQDRLHQPFERIMRSWLTAPAGMKQADFTEPLPASSHAHTARGHLADGSVVAGGWRNHPEQAAAGLWATASDMAAFLIEIRKGWQGRSTVFARDSIRELLANPIDGHAYGFRLIGDGDQVFLTHYGGTVGYRAGMTLNLNSGDGAVYLSNSDNGSDLGLEFLGAVSGVYDWPMFRQTLVERAKQPLQVLKSLTGRYKFEGPTVLVVHERETLTLVFPNGDRYAMTPIAGAPREFIHPDTAVRASFDGQGADMTMQLYGETGRRLADDE
jgi:CubicO group peptidase (beta-lactamase class C family)